MTMHFLRCNRGSVSTQYAVLALMSCVCLISMANLLAEDTKELFTHIADKMSSDETPDENSQQPDTDSDQSDDPKSTPDNDKIADQGDEASDDAEQASFRHLLK